MGIDDVFAVIAEGTRRQILTTLREGDKAVGELVVELQVSQPTVSKHLKVLREAGLVTMRAQGQKRYYSLETGPLGQVQDWLAEFEAGTGEAAGPPTPSEDVTAEVPALVGPGSTTGPDDGVLAPAVLTGSAPAVEADTIRPPIGRTMNRAAERAADLLSQLRRRRES